MLTQQQNKRLDQLAMLISSKHRELEQITTASGYYDVLVQGLKQLKAERDKLLELKTERGFMKKPEPKFCSKCGSELKRHVVGAENYTYTSGYYDMQHYYNFRDLLTGDRNLIVECYCPKRSRWFNWLRRHDKFSEGEPFLREGIADSMLPLEILWDDEPQPDINTVPRKIEIIKK